VRHSCADQDGAFVLPKAREQFSHQSRNEIGARAFVDDLVFRLSPDEHSDMVDAHVVLCARRTGQQVVTSDPDDLRRLDRRLKVVIV